jgi:glycosyltransferase involved in cell wall biosynthesis
MAQISQLIVLGRVAADPELCAAVGNVDVTFLSWVEDYRVELAKATVIVTPDLVGTGLKNRVLQSMAVGRPVVGTSIAFEAIDIVSGREAVSVDSPDEMARELDRLLQDEELCAAIGSAGREWVIRRFSADAISEQWNNLYDAIAGNMGKNSVQGTGSL